MIYKQINKWSLALLVLVAGSCISEQVEPTFECPTIQVFVDEVQNTQCDEANGSFMLSATGGEAPYTFQTSLGSNGDGVYNNVPGGTYNVTVSDANDCSTEIEVSVQNDDGIVIDEIVVTDAGCGTTDGRLQIIVSGGREPYSFTINNNAPQSNSVFTDLEISEYLVTATDASGCETTQSVEVLSGVSYGGAIENIVETNCAIPGCHDGSRFPDLRTLDNIQAQAERIKIRTGNRTMPRGRTLTDEEIEQIACWVDDGALEN